MLPNKNSATENVSKANCCQIKIRQHIHQLEQQKYIWRHLVQIVVSQCRVDEAVEPLGIELGL